MNNSDLLELCCLCQAHSIQQTKPRAVCVNRNKTQSSLCPKSSHLSGPPSCLVTCLHCNKKQCLACCSELHKLLVKKAGHKDLVNHSWFFNISNLLKDTSSFNGSSIDFGTCCQFTQSIQAPIPQVSVTFSKTFAPASRGLMNLFSNQIESDSDSDSDYLPIRVIGKKLTTLIKHNKTQNKHALDFLRQYHDPNQSSPLKPRIQPICPVTVNKKRKFRKKSLLEHNRYLGALYLRQFSLLLLPEADNANLRTDIVGFGVSNHPLNQSPPVYHQGVDMILANAIMQKIGTGSLKKIPAKNWEYPVDIANNAPEDNSKSRIWTVQFVNVYQMIDTTEAKESRGTLLADPNLLEFFHEFGQSDLRDDVDVTILIGNFRQSESIHPKMLCMKFGKMIKGSLSDKDAHAMYACFQHVSGRAGFEIRRKDGSSGFTSPQSDVNLMAVLHHLHSAIPRKIWGTFILRTKLEYIIFYKRANPSEKNKAEWTHVWYSPPLNGGKFKMPKSLIEKYPTIGEFCYQKMLAVTIMDAINTHRMNEMLSPIALAETQNELANIKKARLVFDCESTSNMLDFVHKFNTLNDFNQITHVVGSHEDYFPGGPSFENRMLVVNKNLKGYGRGGGLFTNLYTWSIVDWTAVNKANNAAKKNSTLNQSPI